MFEYKPGTCYFFALLIVILDQMTKLLVEQFLSLGDSIPIVETFQLLRLTFITNTGAAWGILQGYNIFLVSVALLVSAACIWIIQTTSRPLIRLSATCILGGGFGNMLDRLFLSTGVVDFIDLGIYRYRWPAFNVADTLLSLGMLFFVWATIREEVSFLNPDQWSRETNNG